VRDGSDEDDGGSNLVTDARCQDGTERVLLIDAWYWVSETTKARGASAGC
jgi:hypothetical protein